MNYSYDKEQGFWQRPSGEAFTYSDGDAVERRILSIVRAARDRSVFSAELRTKITDWPTRYHLHPSRANLLRPFEPLLRGASVLELGGGCGALTRYLGETCGRVTMVEGSARRCAIAAARCQGLSSVSVYCDTILRAEPPTGPFDVVTLIGVLEYARVYETAVADPIQAVLEKARSLLKPGGTLLLALENQLGLKYFAGAAEDHCNAPMVGINDAYRADGVVTFGVGEMTERLRGAGFMSLRQYLPFPDYKLPVLMVHPEARDLAPEAFNLGALLAECVRSEAPGASASGFSLEQNWGVVARNGLAWDLTNSLCFAARTEAMPQLLDQALGQAADGVVVIASHYSTNRRPRFNKSASFILRDSGVVVRRTPLGGGVADAAATLQQHYPEEEPYYAGAKYSDALCTLLNRRHWTVAQIAEWNLPLLRFWEQHAVTHEGKAFLPSSMMDCIARNVLRGATGELRCIDQEWSYGEDRIPLVVLAFYNVYTALEELRNVESPAPGTSINIRELCIEVLRHMGLDFSEQAQEVFETWLQRFYTEALGPINIQGYKTATLIPRYPPEALRGFLKVQAQKIQELQAEVDSLTKERDMPARVMEQSAPKA